MKVYELLIENRQISTETKFRAWLEINLIAAPKERQDLAVTMAALYREDPAHWRQVELQDLFEIAAGFHPS